MDNASTARVEAPKQPERSLEQIVDHLSGNTSQLGSLVNRLEAIRDTAFGSHRQLKEAEVPVDERGGLYRRLDVEASRQNRLLDKIFVLVDELETGLKG